MPKLFKTNALKSAPGSVDAERGIISDVSIVEKGEAKGHGVQLDDDFLDDVVRLGNEKSGVRMRFGHPNMCSTSLGKFMGHSKQFRKVDGKVVANQYLSKTAQESPDGNLYDYVLNMAQNEPDEFGMSIAFNEGPNYYRDEDGSKVYEGDDRFQDFSVAEHGLPFASIERLRAVDYVDEGAATGGLFSTETVAQDVTEFFDANPEALDAIIDSPQIIKAISKYGNKVEEFITAYRECATQTITQPVKPKEESESQVDSENEKQEEATEAAESTEATASEGVTEQSTEEPEAAESAEETNEENAEDSEQDSGETESESSELGYREAAKAFGVEITEQAWDAGGGYDEARDLYYQNLEKENKDLKEKAAAFEKGESAIDHTDKTEGRKGFFKTTR